MLRSAFLILFLLVTVCCMAADFFEPVMVDVGIERSSHSLGHYDVSPNAYRRASELSVAHGTKSHGVLSHLMDKRRSHASSGAVYVASHSLSGGSYSSATTSKNNSGSDYTVSGGTVPFADGVGVFAPSAPCRVPAGPPIGQFVPLSGDCAALLFCAAVYTFVSIVRRRRKGCSHTDI